MKIRVGYVSNSSSASYIVDLDKYPTVFSLVKAMFELTINTKNLLHCEEDREYAKEDLKRLEKAIKEGIDPDLPLFNPGNYDTIIVKTEDYYQIDTDFVYPFSDLKGFHSVGDYCEDFEYPEEYFYLHLGVYGKALDDSSLSPEEARCEKHDKEKMIIKGVIICPDCFKEQPEIFDEEVVLISDLEPMEISAIKEIENLIGQELNVLKILNVLSVGIKITNKTITGLSLYDCKFKSIPQSIKNLKSIKTLYLRQNKLKELPSSLFDLKNLEELDLGANKIGDLSEKVGGLKNLKSLDLRGGGRKNKTNITSLPESFGNLISLKILNLYGNDLKNLPESFGNLKSLEELNLKLNALNELPESFGNLKSLINLNLGGNAGIYIGSLTQLPESFGNLKKLEILDLSNLKLNRLPVSFGNLISLKNLNLEYNRDFSNLPASFGNLKSLEELNLKLNALNELPESFGNIISLKKLNLENNKLKTLPESFGNLKCLESLTIYRNKLESLPVSFGKLKNLSYINLGSNNLKMLPNSFGDLRSIEFINFSNCKLETFPNMICQLTNLERLDLGGNNLGGVSDSIGNMTSLITLELGGCALKSLPDSICELKSLKYLGLWHNDLRSLPECIGNLMNLKSINLSYNRFLKSLPKTFKKLSSLKGLSLDGTSLENIPKYEYIEHYIRRGNQTGRKIVHYCIATKKEIPYDDQPQFIMKNLNDWIQEHKLKLDDKTIKQISQRLAKSDSSYTSESECLEWRYPIPDEIKGKGFKHFSFGRLFEGTYYRHMFHIEINEIDEDEITDDLIIDLKIKIDKEDLYILCDGTYN